MLFSIIIPIWNDEKFLAECLDSCLNQELSPEEFEIICIDDGSTDRTPEILRDYEAAHANLRVITKKHGNAYGFGRDMGLAAATGEFVWFVDHDDIVAPSALTDMKTAMETDDSFDRIAFPYYEFYEELTPLEQKLLQEGKLVPNVGDQLSALALWTGVIRRSFMIEHDIWPNSKRILAAGAYWGIEKFRPWGGDNVCMEECFDCGMRTKLLSGTPLYLYRRHSEAQTMAMSKKMIEYRERLRFNAAMLRGYLVAKLKEQWHAERAANGQASKETTVAMIMKLRRCVTSLSRLSRSRWKEGIGRLREKDLFFAHKPPEYTFSFRDYLKTRTRKEKLSPSTYAYYYCYTLAGARWVRFFTFYKRLSMKSPELIRTYRKHKQKQDQKRGVQGFFPDE